jgi:tetratricopeptide (TPR) repeat protein
MTISTSSRSISGALAAFLSITPVVARAAGPAPAATSAKDEYARGAALYKAGSFADAAQAFIAAYKLRPKPLILFNIGQAYRKMGALDGALAYYQRFLREAAPAERAPLEADTRKYIAEIEKELEERRREEQARADAERAARERRARETAEALAADRERAERERLDRERAQTATATATTTATTAPTTTTAQPTTMTPASVVEPRVDAEARAQAREKRPPVYKSAALWVPVSLVVVAGVALGVGLGLGLRSNEPALGIRTVTFP